MDFLRSPSNFVDSTQVLLALSTFILILYGRNFHNRRKRYNFPRGPKGYPFFGIFWDIINYPAYLAYTEWGKIYGGIYSINIMRQKVVVLNDVEHIREAMLKCSPKVDSRSNWRYCFMELLRGLSVMPYSRKWINTRRRAVTILRNYGMGKSFFEPVICKEASHLVEKILQVCCDGALDLDLKRPLQKAPVNIICNMLFSERYEYEDEGINFILDTIEKLLTYLRTGCVYDSLPAMLRPFAEGSLVEYRRGIRSLHEFLNNKIKNHEDSYDPEKQRDFIDAWIAAQVSSTKDKNDNVVTKDEHDKQRSPYHIQEEDYSPVCDVLQDVLIAGSQSTGHALNWLVLMLVLHKDIQDELHKSILEEIGPDEMPSMSDKSRLPLMEACIYETLRVASLTPLIGHSTAVDVSISGHLIPANTEVTYNNWAVNFDEEAFPQAKSFLPKRWLKEDGTFDHKATANFFPFGIGKRACAGEALAKMEMFIFATILLQKIEFLPPDLDKSDPSYPKIKHSLSFVLQPYHYLLRVKRRATTAA